VDGAGKTISPLWTSPRNRLGSKATGAVENPAGHVDELGQE
jgi:hypothetical protein